MKRQPIPDTARKLEHWSIRTGIKKDHFQAGAQDSVTLLIINHLL
jgi:hypothetical protein